MKTFRMGGVHPAENKLSAGSPIREAALPKQAIFSMFQHIGAPAKPVVKKGDVVKVGTLLGEAGGFVSAPIYSSVSGKVSKVDVALDASDTRRMAVYVDVEGDEWEESIDRSEALVRLEDRPDLDAQAIVEKIKQAGIVGMGGATFPTHVKLSSGLGKVDTIIVNVSECEPFIVADDRLCREYPTELISGLKIIMRILGLQTAHIGMEDNKPEAAKALRDVLSPADGIVVDILPAKYPQGAEKQLIYAVTGREVPSGGLPAAVGCAVFNAATCKAIHDAVYEGMPLVKRIVTVSGDICMEAKNLMVPIGTPFNQLLDAVGVSENPYKVLSGGPMMGAAQYDLAVPVIKGSNAVTILGSRNKFVVEQSRCIRCGRCIDACPMHLMPVLIYKASQTGSVDEMMNVHLMDCIECGSCAYTCPASVPLVLGFRASKHIVREAAKAKK